MIGMASESWDVRFGPCDPLNPGFGYELEVRRNGERVLFTGKHPVSGKDLDFDACLDVARMYGPLRSEWARNVLEHCDRATSTSLATMRALGKDSSKIRKAVGK